MTLPSSDNYLTYGGELVDYSAVENPQTDLSAEASNSMRASVAGMSATCFRAIINFHVDVSDVIIDNMYAVWDVDTSDAPTMSKVEPGWYQIVFPTEVYDLRAQTQNLNLLGGIANPNVSNTDKGYYCTVNKIDNVTFDIFMWNVADTTREDIAETITLCVR